jgi:tetratricopeptide (TPR) repeat protein
MVHRTLLAALLSVALFVGSSGVGAESLSRGGRGRAVADDVLPGLPGPPQLRAAYWGALSLVGMNQWPGARDSVVELERAVATASRVEGLAELSRAQIDVAGRLAEITYDCLPPITLLHLGALEAYRGEPDQALVTHSSTVAAHLAELYAGLAGTVEARGFASSAMACVAGTLGSEAAFGQARRLLERAVRLDPRGEIAGLLLGALDEREGRYGDAVEVLRPLVQAHPDAVEARLRLAVNLRRVGKTADARVHLVECTQPRHDRWVRSVAYDELARLALDAEHWRGAQAVLEEAAAALGPTQSVILQLSYVLDRLHVPLRARTLTAMLPGSVEAGSRPESDRFRYTVWPDVAVAGAREAVRQRGQASLPALSNAIATTSSAAEQSR